MLKSLCLFPKITVQRNCNVNEDKTCNGNYVCYFSCAGNVLKEISEPAGAVIRVKDFMLGDPTISVLELWGAEYQESNALLVHADDRQTLQDICDREKVPVSFVGEITGKQW